MLQLPRFQRRYLNSLQTSPIATKSITCLAAFLIGDVSAQVASSRARRLEERLATIDAGRTLRMALFGLVWSGPAGHHFYKWLDKVLMPGNPTALAAVVGKVAVDQLIYSPVSTALFFTWLNLTSATPENIPVDLSEKLAPSVKTSWAFWVPTMAVNMSLIPVPMRILWINMMAIVWMNIFSTMASAPTPVELPTEVGLEAFAALPDQKVSEGMQYRQSTELPSSRSSLRFAKDAKAVKGQGTCSSRASKNNQNSFSALKSSCDTADSGTRGLKTLPFNWVVNTFVRPEEGEVDGSGVGLDSIATAFVDNLKRVSTAGVQSICSFALDDFSEAINDLVGPPSEGQNGYDCDALIA